MMNIMKTDDSRTNTTGCLASNNKTNTRISLVELMREISNFKTHC